MAKATKVAVVGIGHELRGDDAAGVAVIRALAMAAAGNDDLLLIEAGPAPENQIGPLIRARPDVIVFVDAAEMREAPGTVRWILWDEAGGLGASTHMLSPQVLAQFLISQLGCEVRLLGIQPLSYEVGAELSPPVVQAVQNAADALLRMERRTANQGDLTMFTGRRAAHAVPESRTE